MKNTIAVSQRAATAVFLSIASSDIAPADKGQLMVLASGMMEHPEDYQPADFEALPGGGDVYAQISLAVRRSQRARAAVAARRAALHQPETQAASSLQETAETAPVKPSESPAEGSASGHAPHRVVPAEALRPARHPRLKIKCRYATRSKRIKPRSVQASKTRGIQT